MNKENNDVNLDSNKIEDSFYYHMKQKNKEIEQSLIALTEQLKIDKNNAVKNNQVISKDTFAQTVKDAQDKIKKISENYNDTKILPESYRNKILKAQSILEQISSTQTNKNYDINKKPKN